MLEKIPGYVASRCWPYLVAKPSHTGVDVDGLAGPLHHPTAVRRGDKASCQVPSCPVVQQRAVAPY
jgi:hypothetical protein